VPTIDYCERSYHLGGAPLSGARTRLDALGLAAAPLVGGVWLKRWTPRELPDGVRTILDRSDGYFVFTTYSLWLEPGQLAGPYELRGSPDGYWRALLEVNRWP
jgi:hypothetical protein